jgi:hypothetical protein
MESGLLEKLVSEIIDKLHMLPDEEEGKEGDKPEGVDGLLDGKDGDGKAGIEIMKVMGDKKPMLGDDEENEEDSGDDLKRKLLMGK